MTSYVGETIGVKCDARDPFTGVKLTAVGYLASVDFYVPGATPKTDLVARAAPALPDRPMTYDPTILNVDGTEGAWILRQPTVGVPWVAGRWTYRVTIVGANYDNFEFATFNLKP